MILIRHILREHIAPFVYSLVVITGLFLVDFVVQILDSILTKGLAWRVVMELFVLNAAWMLALSVPMSVLVASLMAFGRMSADGEIDAMRAAGLHPAKMLFPGLLAGLLLAGGLTWFNDQVLPQANFRAASLREDISRKRPAVLLQPRTMIQDFDGFRLWIGSNDPKTDSLRDVTIYQLDRSGGQPTVISARGGRVRLDSLQDAWIFSLREGETHSPDREKPANYLRIRFAELDVTVPNIDSRLHRTDKGYRGDREMPVSEMERQMKQALDRQATLVKESSERIFSDLRWIQNLLELDSGAVVAWKNSRDSGTEMVLSQAGPTKPPAGRPFRPGSAKRPPPPPPPALSTLSEPDPSVYGSAARTLKFLAQSRLSETRTSLEQISWERNEANRYRVEIHKKFSIPVACILFVLVGAPLGILARSGGIGTGASYSLTFFVMYWAALIGGETLADKGRIDGALAMWLPDIVIGTIGLLLVSRMGRHSQFFRYEWLFSLLRRAGLSRKATA
jgi:lipopolysaccharide export system permease protein